MYFTKVFFFFLKLHRSKFIFKRFKKKEGLNPTLFLYELLQNFFLDVLILMNHFCNQKLLAGACRVALFKFNMAGYFFIFFCITDDFFL